MNNDRPEIENILKNHSGKIDREALEKAKKTGDASALINKLSTEEKQKLNTVLNDKEQLSQVLKSPQAQMLLKLFGGGKNG